MFDGSFNIPRFGGHAIAHGTPGDPHARPLHGQARPRRNPCTCRRQSWRPHSAAWGLSPR